MSIIDPAADHMKEVHSDGEIQTLFPSTDEEPQTEGAARTMRIVLLSTAIIYIQKIFVWIQKCHSRVCVNYLSLLSFVDKYNFLTLISPTVGNPIVEQV